MNRRFRGLPSPEGRVFESRFRVRFHEVDGLGHVNNASFLNYLEQTAIDHAASVGIDLDRLRELGGVFVARRHEIEFLRPSFAGDTLRVVTWLGVPRGATIERYYRVHRDATQLARDGSPFAFGEDPSEDSLVVQAITEWAFVSEMGVPRRIPPKVHDAFSAAG